MAPLPPTIKIKAGNEYGPEVTYATAVDIVAAGRKVTVTDTHAVDTWHGEHEYPAGSPIWGRQVIISGRDADPLNPAGPRRRAELSWAAAYANPAEADVFLILVAEARRITSHANGRHDPFAAEPKNKALAGKLAALDTVDQAAARDAAAVRFGRGKGTVAACWKAALDRYQLPPLARRR